MNEFLLLAQLIKNGEFEEVDSTYLKELKEQLGQAIYPINKVYFYNDDNNTLIGSWTIEELQEKLAINEIDQKLYLDNYGTILYVPNTGGNYWISSAEAVDPNDHSISYYKYFDANVLTYEYDDYTGQSHISISSEEGYSLINLIRVYPEEEEAGSGEAATDTFNADGQYVDIIIHSSEPLVG